MEVRGGSPAGKATHVAQLILLILYISVLGKIFCFFLLEKVSPETSRQDELLGYTHQFQKSSDCAREPFVL